MIHINNCWFLYFPFPLLGCLEPLKVIFHFNNFRSFLIIFWFGLLGISPLVWIHMLVTPLCPSYVLFKEFSVYSIWVSTFVTYSCLTFIFIFIFSFKRRIIALIHETQTKLWTLQYCHVCLTSSGFCLAHFHIFLHRLRHFSDFFTDFRFTEYFCLSFKNS